MDYLNSTKSELSTTSSLRTLTLNQFKKKIFGNHQKANDLNITTYPKIVVTKINISKNSKENLLNSINESTSSLTNENRNRNSKLKHPYYEDFNYDETIEKDINPLLSYYQFTSTRSANNNFEKFNNNISESDKKELFTKYTLNSQNNSKDKSSYVTNTDPNVSNYKKREVKPRFVIHDEFFKNPANSNDTIKLNKKIYENIMNITLQKQTKKYIDHYKKVERFIIIRF